MPTESVVTLLRLALGVPADLAAVNDWRELLALAVRERCAALAWLRSGEAIRAAADERTAAQWRGVWSQALAVGHAQIEVTAEAFAVLADYGIRPIVLKGAPLAMRLYGDPTVRCSTDLDWYLPRAELGRAHEILRTHGWSRKAAGDSWDHSLCRKTNGGETLLELHDSLTQASLDHLDLPAPIGEPCVVGSTSVLAHAGASVPGYLALHHASHAPAPLLWTVDFATVWAGLSTGEREAANAIASTAGIGKYLKRAIRHGERARRAAAGDRRSGTVLARSLSRSGLPPVIWRSLAMSDSPASASRAARRWIAPPWAAERYGPGLRGVIARLARHSRTSALLGSRRAPDGGTAEAQPNSERAGGRADLRGSIVVAEVDGPRLLSVVREVTTAGGELWVRVSGQSMMPRLAPGDEVLLGAAAETRVGDVAFISLGGRPVLHRVVEVADEGLRTAGDCGRPDPQVSWDQVIARVVAMRRERVVVPLRATLRFGIRPMVRWLPYTVYRTRVLRRQLPRVNVVSRQLS